MPARPIARSFPRPRTIDRHLGVDLFIEIHAGQRDQTVQQDDDISRLLARFSMVAFAQRLLITPQHRADAVSLLRLLSGAVVLAYLVTLGKYSDPSWTPGESYPGWRMLGGLRLDALAAFFLLVIGAASAGGSQKEGPGISPMRRTSSARSLFCGSRNVAMRRRRTWFALSPREP